MREGKVEPGSVHSTLAAAWSAALTGPLTGNLATPDGMAEVLAVFGLDDGQDPQQLTTSTVGVTAFLVREAGVGGAQSTQEGTRGDTESMSA